MTLRLPMTDKERAYLRARLTQRNTALLANMDPKQRPHFEGLDERSIDYLLMYFSRPDDYTRDFIVLHSAFNLLRSNEVWAEYHRAPTSCRMEVWNLRQVSNDTELSGESVHLRHSMAPGFDSRPDRPADQVFEETFEADSYPGTRVACRAMRWMQELAKKGAG